MSGFTKTDSVQTPRETLVQLNYNKENQVVSQNEIRLPYDFSTVIPDRGLAWLYKYGITDDEIKQFRFGYSERIDRLILPVYDESGLLYWQGRNLGSVSTDKPKYINVRSGGKDIFFKRTSMDSSCVCLVEDILSAIKVGRVINSISLLGSYIPSSALSLLSNYNKVYLWLDSDKWKESLQYAKRWSTLTGRIVIPIYTKKDPKECDNECIGAIFQ